MIATACDDKKKETLKTIPLLVIRFERFFCCILMMQDLPTPYYIYRGIRFLRENLHLIIYRRFLFCETDDTLLYICASGF